MFVCHYSTSKTGYVNKYSSIYIKLFHELILVSLFVVSAPTLVFSVSFNGSNTLTDILACSANELTGISTFRDELQGSSIMEYEVSSIGDWKMVLTPLGSDASFPMYDDTDVI